METNDLAWSSFGDRRTIGDRVDGTVIKETEFGVFVQVEKGVEGLVHQALLTVPWPRLGESLALEILNMDVSNKRLVLAPKGNTMRRRARGHPPGVDRQA